MLTAYRNETDGSDHHAIGHLNGVLGIVRRCYQKNLELLGQHEGVLRELVARLVEEGQLLGPEVHGLVEGKGTGSPQPAR